MNLKRKILLGVVLLAGFIFALEMRIPEEKIHLINFGLLGWLSLRDFTKNCHNFFIVAICSIYTVS